MGAEPPSGWVMMWKNPEGTDWTFHIAKSIGGGQFIEMTPVRSDADLRVSDVDADDGRLSKRSPSYLGAFRPPEDSAEHRARIQERARLDHERYGTPDKSIWIDKLCVQPTSEDILETNCIGEFHRLNPEFRDYGWVGAPQIYDELNPDGNRWHDLHSKKSKFEGRTIPARVLAAEPLAAVSGDCPAMGEDLLQGTRKDPEALQSWDPNEKVGNEVYDPAGTMPWERRGFVPSGRELTYVVFFENLESATAPAQEVVVEDQLDSMTLDLNRLSLGEISFGDTRLELPEDSNCFSTTVDLRPDKDLLLEVEACLDTETGSLRWRLKSIDPETGELPEDPLAGFLPPNANPPEGEGHVVFKIWPKAELDTGTEVGNMATITFDVNEPIDTEVWRNTIDAEAPESEVVSIEPLEGGSSGEYEIQWEAADDYGGSGVRDTTLYVSADGGSYATHLSDVTDTATIIDLQCNTDYGFYTRARDNVGNVEDAPDVADVELLRECFELISPEDGMLVYADTPPIEFRWYGGEMEKFKVRCSRGKRKVNSGKRWLSQESYVPNTTRWRKTLRLGKSGRPLAWFVVGRDEDRNMETTGERTLTVADATPATLTSVPNTVPADGPPPTFEWDMNHNDACKLTFARRSNLRGKPRAKSGKGYRLRGTSWTPPAKVWRKITTKIAPKNPDGTVYYRIDCKDALKRRTRGEVWTLRVVEGP